MLLPCSSCGWDFLLGKIFRQSYVLKQSDAMSEDLLTINDCRSGFVPLFRGMPEEERNKLIDKWIPLLPFVIPDWVAAERLAAVVQQGADAYAGRADLQ